MLGNAVRVEGRGKKENSGGACQLGLKFQSPVFALHRTLIPAFGRWEPERMGIQGLGQNHILDLGLPQLCKISNIKIKISKIKIQES